MGRIEIRRGPAGSGKSAHIAEEIAALVHESPLGAPIYWIVPPSASYEMERRLLTAVDTTVRAEVLHLDRLAKRIQGAVGGIRETAVNTTGKRLLLATVYQECAEQLTVLHRVAPSISFLDAILDVFREMADYCVSPAAIEAALESAAAAIAKEVNGLHSHAGRSLLGKLRDICLLYVGWQRKLADNGLYDPNFLLTKLAPLASSWHDLAGATLYVDGHSTFTPQQIKFLLALADQAELTVITLPLASELPTTDIHSVLESLVHVPEQEAVPEALWAWAALKTEAQRLGLPVTDAVMSDTGARFRNAPDLACLENLLYANEDAPPTVRPEHVQILTAQSVREEVEGAATRICEWMEQAHVNYQDVLIIVTDEETYLPQLARSFARYGIPFHGNDSPPLASHPLARFLLAVIAAVQDGYSVEAMTRFLRSPFSGFTLAAVDWLETYLATYEVAGTSWFAAPAWRHAEDNREDDAKLAHAAAEDSRAERLRQKVLRLLSELVEPFSRPTITPQGVARALWALLERAGAKQDMAEWIVGDASTDNPMQASLHEQAWIKLMDLLNDLTDTLPDAALPTSFLLQLVQDALYSAGLVTIPAGVDEVAVVNLQRAAGIEAKLVIVLGAADGALPVRVHQDGMLLDEERTAFRALFGTRLGFTTDERQVSARKLSYFALTRASEALMVSYPLAGNSGKAVRPSLLVGRLQAMFQGSVSQVHYTDASCATLNDTSLVPLYARMTPAIAWEHIVSTLRNKERAPAVAGIASSILAAQRGNEPQWLQRTLAGWQHQTGAATLSAALTERLYGRDMQMNVHQLEAFAQCPYRHYGQYGLRLREEQTTDVNAAVRGTLMHDAVERFVALQMTDAARMMALTDEAAKAQMDTIFRDLMDSPKMQVWLRRLTRRQQAAAVREVLRSAAVVLTKHARHGAFRPQAIELAFGTGTDAQLDSWQVPLGDGLTLHLRGRIDRVDTAQTPDGKHWFRVIDYKSSKIDLDLSKVAHGLQLQLPVYALVLAAQGEPLFAPDSQPAGLIYLPLRHQITAKAVPETVEEALKSRLSAMRADGRMIADVTVVEAMDERIAAGTSDLFKKFYTKDGAFLKTAPVLTQADWSWLFAQVQATVIRLAEAVGHGDIAIQPTRYGVQDACTFCALSAVCGIDRNDDEALFRKLPKLSGDKMQNWRQWAEKGRESDG